METKLKIFKVVKSKDESQWGVGSGVGDECGDDGGERSGKYIYIVQDDGAKVDGEDDDEAVGGEGGKESGSG